MSRQALEWAKKASHINVEPSPGFSVAAGGTPGPAAVA